MSDETQDYEAPVAEETTAAPVEEPKVHPAHEKLLAELPEAWHSKVTPYLQEQDKYYQKEMEKYTPFKEYVDQGIPAELIAGGINIARAIETNPTEVYSSLQDYLMSQGLLADEAAVAAADIMEEQSGEEFDNLFDSEVSPEVRAELEQLRAQTESVNDYIYQQEFEKASAEEFAILETDMAALRSQYTISEAHEEAIYNLMNAALNAGEETSVALAANQLSAMIGGFQGANATPGEEAPMIVGSAGGAGIPTPNLGVPKDDKGKKAMLAQMFEQYNAANR